VRLARFRAEVLAAIDRAGSLDGLRKEVVGIGHKKKPRRVRDLKDRCDELFSLIVRARDGRCVECGAVTDLQCAHGFSRFYRGTRWDERNAWALDKACHVRYTFRPIEWKAWMVKRLGQDGYDALERDARHGIRKLDLKLLLVCLEARARELGVLPKAKRA
jgi:hypothetical protein